MLSRQLIIAPVALILFTLLAVNTAELAGADSIHLTCNPPDGPYVASTEFYVANLCLVAQETSLHSIAVDWGDGTKAEYDAEIQTGQEFCTPTNSKAFVGEGSNTVTIQINGGEVFRARITTTDNGCTVTENTETDSFDGLEHLFRTREHSQAPSPSPTNMPSAAPNIMSSVAPSLAPSTKSPTSPSRSPSLKPSKVPSTAPIPLPNSPPTVTPSDVPSPLPTIVPSSTEDILSPLTKSLAPSTKPFSVKSTSANNAPTHKLSSVNTAAASAFASFMPSSVPSMQPSDITSVKPSSASSTSPSPKPSTNNDMHVPVVESQLSGASSDANAKTQIGPTSSFLPFVIISAVGAVLFGVGISIVALVKKGRNEESWRRMGDNWVENCATSSTSSTINRNMTKDTTDEHSASPSEEPVDEPNDSILPEVNIVEQSVDERDATYLPGSRKIASSSDAAEVPTLQANTSDTPKLTKGSLPMRSYSSDSTVDQSVDERDAPCLSGSRKIAASSDPAEIPTLMANTSDTPKLIKGSLSMRSYSSEYTVDQAQIDPFDPFPTTDPTLDVTFDHDNEFNDAFEPLPMLLELDAAMARWNSISTFTYEYVTERLCYCAPPRIRPVNVVVTGGEKTGITYLDSGSAVPSCVADEVLTIEEQFDLIRDAIVNPTDSLDVLYDPIRGYPTQIYYKNGSRRRFSLRNLIVAECNDKSKEERREEEGGEEVGFRHFVEFPEKRSDALHAEEVKSWRSSLLHPACDVKSPTKPSSCRYENAETGVALVPYTYGESSLSLSDTGMRGKDESRSLALVVAPDPEGVGPVQIS